MGVCAGLDVGGAHLKVALAEAGELLDVCQYVCPLWQGLDRLDTALAEASEVLSRADAVALTMTGELSDLFANRTTGVSALLDVMEGRFGSDVQVWQGQRGMGTLAQARRHPADVGSTNFLATASLVARHHAHALLIDFGSTTADIIAIRDGAPYPRGLTDAARQTSGELVYTGYTRTAVMGVVDRAPFKGEWVTLAREYLATMADVRRILGTLPEGSDLHATADGKGKSLEESVARFARHFGRDGIEGTLAEWRTVAAYVHEVQLRSLHDGAFQVLSGIDLPESAPVIAAGTGALEIRTLADRLARPATDVGTLIGASGDLRERATASAPAVAVALLAN